MSILNIDRHILMHIVSLQKQKETHIKIIEKNWVKISSYFAQENAICDIDKIPSPEMRRKQLKCMQSFETAMSCAVRLDSELHALLQHIINEVNEVDSEKDEEFIDDIGGEYNG